MFIIKKYISYHLVTSFKVSRSGRVRVGGQLALYKVSTEQGGMQLMLNYGTLL